MPGSSYRTFDHTADIGIRATGRSREELFANAAQALGSVICDLRTVRPVVFRTIGAEAEPGDDAQLLVAFLSEVLYVTSVEHLLFRHFSVSFPSPSRVTATAHGEPERERHEIRREVKAVTYHQAQVRRQGDGYRAQVILDI